MGGPPLPKAQPACRRRGAEGQRVEHVCARCARKGRGSVQRVFGNPCAGAGPGGLRLRPLLWRGGLRGLELLILEANSAREIVQPSPSLDELGVAMQVVWHDVNAASSSLIPLSISLCDKGFENQAWHGHIAMLWCDNQLLSHLVAHGCRCRG